MTIDINITRWLKERQINYFYDMNIIYADVFGTDEFYRIEAEHVVGNVYEVFFCTDSKKSVPLPYSQISNKGNGSRHSQYFQYSYSHFP